MSATENNTSPDLSTRRRSRRNFISCLGGAITCSTIPAAFAMRDPVSIGDAANQRSLIFHHLHTGESLEATYWNGLDYDSKQLQSIDYLLRDFRTGDVHPIEKRLLDILHQVRTELAVESPFEVIGGYRSPKTNNMLRRRSSGVAKKSLHMQGRAIDVRIPDVNSKLLREVAADLKLGGVGYYRSSNFVHLDTGRPRVW